MNLSIHKRHTLTLDDDPLVPRILEKITGVRTIAYQCPATLMSNLRRHRPLAIFVDIHLGEESITGLQLIPQLRKRFPHVPILVLTSDPTEGVLEEALNSGADDFLRKPIRAAELNARLRVRLKDLHEREQGGVIRFGKLCFEPVCGRLRFNKKEVFVSRLGSKVLYCLMEAQGMATSRHSLKSQAWGRIQVSDNALDKKISELRKLLRYLGSGLKIEAVYNKGFRMNSRDLTPGDEK